MYRTKERKREKQFVYYQDRDGIRRNAVSSSSSSSSTSSSESSTAEGGRPAGLMNEIRAGRAIKTTVTGLTVTNFRPVRHETSVPRRIYDKLTMEKLTMTIINNNTRADRLRKKKKNCTTAYQTPRLKEECLCEKIFI